MRRLEFLGCPGADFKTEAAMMREPRIIRQVQRDGFTYFAEIFHDGSKTQRWYRGNYFVTKFGFHNGVEKKNFIVYRSETHSGQRDPWTVTNWRIAKPVLTLAEAKAIVFREERHDSVSR